MVGSPTRDREVSPLERLVSERTYALSIAQSLHWSEEEGKVSQAPLSGRMRSDLSAAVDCGHPDIPLTHFLVALSAAAE